MGQESDENSESQMAAQMVVVVAVAVTDGR